MKVRKEQFLLPKGKTISTSGSKWIQPNINAGDFSKSVEPLPPGIIAKIKPDMLLSNGDIIVSGQPGSQIFWQQQDGILRQALLSAEKDVKSEDKAMEVEGNQAPASAPAVLTITPVSTTQVIKMSDYKVIVSSEALPIAWQEIAKKTDNTLPLPKLPTIKPKIDSKPPLVIGKQPVTFTTISNVSVLSPNQYPTIMMKDVKTPFQRI